MDRRQFFVGSAFSLLASRANAINYFSFLKGIDVSHHQNEINWKKVAEQGFTFAYIKATTGEGSPDPRFIKNCSQAKEAGLYFGSYHFATVGNWDYNNKFYNIRADAKLEALDYLKRAEMSTNPGNCMPALDLEDDGSHRIRKLSGNQLADWVLQYGHTINKELDVNPLLYGYAYVMKAAKANSAIHKEFPLWLADANGKPDYHPWDNYTLWQHNRRGRVRGVGDKNGHVDINLFNGNETEFKITMLLK